jgi:hypothetical protein
MPRVSLPVLAAIAMLALLGLFARYHEALPDQPSQDTAALLQGTWQREYTSEGVHVRRILSLQSRGAFREEVEIVDASGKLTRQAHEGTWLYDGTNLKRKYTSMNGEPPSRLRVPFATFQISFESANEFTGVDHVHGHRIRYRRLGFDAAS